MYLQSLYIEEKYYARFGGCRPYSSGDIERCSKMCKMHWSAKYRSPGQDTCRVSTSRRSTMQGLVARGLTLEEFWNVDINYVKVTAAKYRSRLPGQGICQVSTLRRSTLQGLMVVCLIVEKIWNVNVNCVKNTGAQNIGQDHWVNARYDGCCRIVVD